MLFSLCSHLSFCMHFIFPKSLKKNLCISWCYLLLFLSCLSLSRLLFFGISQGMTLASVNAKTQLLPQNGYQVVFLEPNIKEHSLRTQIQVTPNSLFMTKQTYNKANKTINQDTFQIPLWKHQVHGCKIGDTSAIATDVL